MSQKRVEAWPSYLGKIAEEPARQVDQVDALVDQFSTAGKFWVGAPFSVVEPLRPPWP